SAPENAFVRPTGSEIDAIATSQPFSTHGLPFPASRTTALIGRPAVRRVCATIPPTFPVIPVMAYIWSCLHEHFKATVDQAFPSKGIGLVSGFRRGSSITFFIPSSRTLREGQMIHEKTTVSSSLRLTGMGRM